MKKRVQLGLRLFSTTGLLFYGPGILIEISPEFFLQLYVTSLEESISLVLYLSFLEINKIVKLIVDQRIKFYSQNTNLLPPKPKSTFRHLKQGIQDFHRKYVLVPADKAANNVVVV